MTDQLRVINSRIDSLAKQYPEMDAMDLLEMAREEVRRMNEGSEEGDDKGTSTDRD